MSRYASDPRVTWRGMALVAGAQALATLLTVGLFLSLRDWGLIAPACVLSLAAMTGGIVWCIPISWLTRLQIFVLLFGLSALVLVLVILAFEGLLDDLFRHMREAG